jgi:hypothetical protein
MLLTNQHSANYEAFEDNTNTGGYVPALEGSIARRHEKSDVDVLNDFNEWMAKKLPCVAGRREFNLKRYMIRIARKSTVPAILQEYKAKLQSGEATACLFVFNEADYFQENSDTSEAFHFLARAMAPIGNECPHALANGAPLTKAFRLVCPVTGQRTLFDDFECIAFCPQSKDKEDPLYDPLMYAPYPCVNMSSDVYAFSRFVADRALTAFGQPLYSIDDIARIAAFLEKSVAHWQRIAMVTITNFEKITDTTLCPVHITSDNTRWIAAHKDPAFAEQEKMVHEHELPVLYAKRITERWLDFFRDRKTYHAGGLARDGVPVAKCPHFAS